MKKLNYILLTLLSTFAFTWTACDDETEWTVPELSTEGRGVYFNSALSSTVELSKEANSFDVEILRSYSDVAETIALNVENESGRFTIPTSVDFKEGKTSAIITIGYDPEVMEYDEFFDVKLSVADASKTFVYGISSYSFKAGVPAPWVSLGMAQYTEDFLTTFFGVDNLTYEVEIQEHSLNPGIYRLVNPYGAAYPYNEEGDYDASSNYYMEINAQDPEGVYITQFNSGMDWGYGEFIMWSFANYYMVRSGASLADVKEAGYCGTLQDGVITFPSNTLLLAMASYNNGAYYYSNGNGKFKVVFPGVEIGDYTAEVTYSGRFTDASGEKNYAVANIALGEDVESAKVAMISGKDVEAAYEGIVDGSIESVEIEKDATLQFELTADGVYTIVAVSYAGGKARETGSASFKYESAGAKWESLGMCTYTDDIMTTFVKGLPTSTYEVEIQENADKPGYYRLVNPYGAAYPYNEEGDYDASTDYYLEIDATDPTAVYLPESLHGIDWGAGYLTVTSYAQYFMDQGYDLETVKAAGYCGTLVDGVITFPANTLLATMANYSDLYYANTNGEFTVVLPSAVNAASAKGVTAKGVATSKSLSNRGLVKVEGIFNRNIKTNPVCLGF